MNQEARINQMKTSLLSNRSSALSRLPWLWPAVISLSAAAAAIVTFGQVPAPLRAIVGLWFLLVCPGMAFVRLLRLKEGIAEWTLAIASSLAMDALVAGSMVYAGAWSPAGGMLVLVAASLAGALLQVKLPADDGRGERAS